MRLAHRDVQKRTDVRLGTRVAILLICVSGWLLAACAAQVITNPATPEVTDAPCCTATPQASATPMLPTDTSTPTSPLLSQYTLTALLDYDLHFLKVDEQIGYVNHSEESLPEIVLVVEPNLYPNVFRLNYLRWGEGQEITSYTLQGHQLNIPLIAPLPPGGRVDFALSYDLNLPNREAPFGFTNRQVNLGDWYPFVPPYLAGNGLLVRDDAYPGENLAYEMADFQVNLQLVKPSSAAALPLIIAASAPVEQDDEWYRYTHENARNFVWSVSDQYRVITTTVGEVTLTSYTFPNHPLADEPALQAAAEALKVFGEILGPYPRKTLTIVEGDFLDGMEFDGLFFLGHAFYDYFVGGGKNNLIIISAHETAHQWWYAQVGNDQALEPWLDEALATFSEALFYERVYPDLSQWWWDNRIYFHKPEGWVDSTIYNVAGFYPYRSAVYLRGALFLRDVRHLIGDDAFFSFLKDYLQRYRGKIATGNDFFAVLQEHTTADLSCLLRMYFANR